MKIGFVRFKFAYQHAYFPFGSHGISSEFLFGWWGHLFLSFAFAPFDFHVLQKSGIAHNVLDLRDPARWSGIEGGAGFLGCVARGGA